MDIQNTLLIIVFIANIFLSIFVFFHREKGDRLNLIFALLAFDIAAWIAAMFLFRQDALSLDNIIVLKILYAVPVFMPVLFLYFIFLFDRRRRVRDRMHASLLRNSLVLLSLSFFVATLYTDLFVVNVLPPSYTGGEKLIVFGTFYPIYMAYMLGIFLYAYILLVKKYFKAHDFGFRHKLKYLFLGTFFPSIIGMATNLILPWYGVFKFNWLANVLAIFFSGFITYAIVKYRFLNVRAIATEVLSFLLIITLLLEMFFAKSIFEFFVKLVILIVVLILNFILIRGMYKEIEERKKIEQTSQKLSEANERLRKLEKQKTEFVSIASHQLRTPLTAIKGYASMLLEGSFGKLPVDVVDAVKKIFKSSQVLVVIIEDFLMVSRIEQGKVKYDFEEIDLVRVLSEVVNSMESDAVEKGNTLSLNIRENIEYIVSADYTKIKQAFRNVIENAIKYTDKGFIKVEVSKFGDWIRVTVSDTGAGMSQETILKLFKKFIKSGDKKHLGTGLGLYVAKEIIKAHKGKIWAQSDGVGYGSTFFIEFPIVNRI